MQYFQPILIIMGLLAIGGVLIHGYILSRKQQNEPVDESTSVDMFAEKTTPELNDAVTEERLDDVISEVRIVNVESAEQEDNIDFSGAINDEKEETLTFTETAEELIETEDSLQIGEDSIDDVESPAVKLDQTEVNIADNHQDEADTFDNLPHGETEPVFETPLTEETEEAPEVEQPQDLFIFNVVAKEGAQLGGHELLQFFLTSGFRFGDMSIFHRHQHSDGKGPVLFSIANMMAPGIFNPEEMEQFKSEGVSFFLTAPNAEICIKESFDMMLRAVEQMAEEFDCIVLNGERNPLTQAEFVEYNNRLLRYI